MMIKLVELKFLIIFLLLVSCRQNTDVKPPSLPENTTDLKLTDREVVLLQSNYNQFLKSYYNYDSWKPNQNDIVKAREIVTQAISDGKFKFLNDPSAEKIWKLFHLQYLPYLNDNNQKVILLNAICNESKVLEPIYYTIENTKKRDTLKWSDFFIDMKDGGPCYWSLKINLDTVEYLELSVNGY